MKAIVDGDVFAYQAACVAEKDVVSGTVDFGECVVPNDHPADPKVILLRSLNWIKQLPKISGIIIALSSEDGSNFRKEIHPGYKAERSEKPEAFQDMIDIMVRDYKTYRFPRLEGDDVMGLLMTGTQGHNYVGVTSDKDVYTLPGSAIRLGHGVKPKKSSVREADKFWMTQTITGDPVDGYKGAPGAGIKAAEKALGDKSSLRGMWDAVLHVYADQFDHKRWGKDFVTKRAYDEALMNARCARILRHGDYDHKTGEVKLWTP